MKPYKPVPLDQLDPEFRELVQASYDDVVAGIVKHAALVYQTCLELSPAFDEYLVLLQTFIDADYADNFEDVFQHGAAFQELLDQIAQVSAQEMFEAIDGGTVH